MPTASRSRALLVAVVLGMAVAAVVVVVRLTGDDRPRAAVGQEVRTEAYDRVPGYTATVAIPFGALTVTVGAPLEELRPECCTDDPAEIRPPEGGSFVGVEAVVDQSELVVLPDLGAEPALAEPELTLVVTRRTELGSEDGQDTYPVLRAREWATGATYRTDERRSYVAVAGRPDVDDLSLEVTYDGVTQEVAVDTGTVRRGAAEALDGATGLRKGQVSCGRSVASLGSVRVVGEPVRCTLALLSSPWLPGAGWAEEGRTWVALTPAPQVPLVLRLVVRGRERDVEVDDVRSRTTTRVVLPGATQEVRAEDAASFAVEDDGLGGLAPLRARVDVRLEDLQPWDGIGPALDVVVGFRPRLVLDRLVLR